MVLHTESGFFAVAQPFDRAVEERQMRYFEGVGKAVRIDHETMVLACDLDAAGGQFLDRMVGATVAPLHLRGRCPHRQRHQLMADADAEDRYVGIDDAADLGGGIAGGGGWVAGAVRQEHPVRLHRKDRVGTGVCRNDRDIAAGVGEAAQDVVLAAEIHRDHTVAGVCLAVACLDEIPASFVPACLGPACHFNGQIHAGKPGPCPGLFSQCGDVEIPARIMADHPGRRAGVTDTTSQGAGVDAGNPGKIVGNHPGLKRPIAPPVRRVGRQLAGDHAKRRRRVRFMVLGIGPDIADMRKGESDDLAGIGRIGHDLLITGHRCIEADFADIGDSRAEAVSFEQASITEN